MPTAKTNKGRRLIRHARVRRKLSGTTDRPRLSWFRSLSHVYAQIIDDSQGITLVAASSHEGYMRNQRNGKAKSDVAQLVGTLIAERAKEKGISSVVFDRGGYKYHGRVKALAEAARQGGLVF